MSDISRSTHDELDNLREWVDQVRPVLDFVIDLLALVRAAPCDVPGVYESVVEKNKWGR
jgi:hypothetical protein